MPIIVRSPAADAVTTNRPPPRSTQSGTSARAARTCASVLTSRLAAQSASDGRQAEAPLDPGVGDEDVDVAEVIAGPHR